MLSLSFPHAWEMGSLSIQYQAQWPGQHEAQGGQLISGTRAAPGAPVFSPAPVRGQVLSDGHQQVGGPMLPEALLGPGCRGPLQLFVPGLQGEET